MICNRIQNCDWLGLFLTFAMNTTQVGFKYLFLRQLSATNRAFVVRSILFDYFYIEWVHIIIYITFRTWIQGIHRCDDKVFSLATLDFRGDVQTGGINSVETTRLPGTEIRHDFLVHGDLFRVSSYGRQGWDSVFGSTVDFYSRSGQQATWPSLAYSSL